MSVGWAGNVTVKRAPEPGIEATSIVPPWLVTMSLTMESPRPVHFQFACFTLTEAMQLDGGQVTNASLADYKIPGIGDVPPMENELIAAEQHSGPFGAKGLGETGTFGVSPAIANAIHDAVGVRITELPITAEAVLRALRAKAGRPLEDE